MYFAYYIMRSDGDADLCAVIENGESIFEDLASELIKSVEQGLSSSFFEWFKVEDSSCDFPDVWDLTSQEKIYNGQLHFSNQWRIHVSTKFKL